MVFPNPFPKGNQTSLTLSGTRKDSQNSSVTKICSIPIMMLKCRAKNEVKTWRHCGDILCKRIKQSHLQRIFGLKLKHQTVKMLEITESISCFYECLLVCQKIKIIASPQNGQTHLKIRRSFPNELFECGWPFWGAGTQTVNSVLIHCRFHVGNYFALCLLKPKKPSFLVLFGPSWPDGIFFH